jgi:hypothetical protein
LHPTYVDSVREENALRIAANAARVQRRERIESSTGVAAFSRTTWTPERGSPQAKGLGFILPEEPTTPTTYQPNPTKYAASTSFFAARAASLVKAGARHPSVHATYDTLVYIHLGDDNARPATALERRFQRVLYDLLVSSTRDALPDALANVRDMDVQAGLLAVRQACHPEPLPLRLIAAMAHPP